MDDAFFIHHRSWWLGEASATRPDPPYEVAGLANKHRIYNGPYVPLLTWNPMPLRLLLILGALSAFGPLA
ncbi:MAG: hypothetical protein WA161_16575, partial [Pseudomonas sp.]|uniref:hypothetical protein n=1 Tax=Pseudomonas sp. TaxID=306 RepID=UPI003BB793FC